MSETERISQTLELIRTSHLALPSAPSKELDELRSRGAPADLLQFYERMNGAGLHRETEYGAQRKLAGYWWRWVVVPLAELETVQDVGYIQPDSPLYARSAQWLALVDVQDGDFLALSVEPGHVGEVIDCFHETVGTPGYSSIIGLSFTELLESLVSGTEAFWLKEGHREYGVY